MYAMGCYDFYLKLFRKEDEKDSHISWAVMARVSYCLFFHVFFFTLTEETICKQTILFTTKQMLGNHYFPLNFQIENL